MTPETDLWEAKKHYIEPALDDGYSLEDVWHEIEQDRAQFWPLPYGAVVTQVLEYPRRRVFRIWLAGGELDQLMYALEHAEEYARHRECDAIEIDGRKGWARVLDGFTETCRVLERKL